MKTLIVGTGALGGIIGARLLAAGASVSLATRNSKSAEEIKASGLRVTPIDIATRRRVLARSFGRPLEGGDAPHHD